MKHQSRIARGTATVILALLLGAAGCGKSLRTGSDPGSIARVSVAAETDGTVQAGVTKKFVAVGTSSTGEAAPTDYAWSLEPATLGTVTGTGAEAYVTGKTPGSGKLVALANGIRGEFPIVIVAGPISDLKVESVGGTTSIAAGEKEIFKVTGLDLGANVVGSSRSRVVLSPAWSVQGSIGTIATDGTFTAAAAGIGKTGQIIGKVDDVSGSLSVSVVEGTRALYVGADTCKGCHAATYADWKTTAHSTAYDRKKSAGTLKASCVSCHVAGYADGGFVDEATTPHLTGIQCENCHGPGSQHVAGNGDKTKILTGDQVLSQPQICGKCHNGSKHGQFEEWQKSPHGEVLEYIGEHYKAADGRYTSCGVCHSGLIRKVRRDGKTFPKEREPEALEGGIGCATCHNPHKATGNGTVDGSTPPGVKLDIQLRYPKSSTAFYAMNSSSPNWDDNIQVCGQCHNHRGASWTGTGRPPHHSPQYNMLIGDMGPEATSGVAPAPAGSLSAHRDIEGQCTHCHMPSNHSVSPVEFGHTFHVKMAGCEPCHTAADAGVRKAATQSDIGARMNALRARLDAWAVSDKSPLASKYGKLAWETTSASAFSNPDGVATIVGPTGAEQTKTNVPDAVKKARHALYLVLHDGSQGVHNAKYARYLLDQAHAQLDTLGVPK